MSPPFIDMELFAWIGEDELGSGELGLKQAIVPAGWIPLVALRQEKINAEPIRLQLQQQASTYGKTIRLCRFRLVEEILKLDP